MRALVRHHGAVPDELPARVHGHRGERGQPGHRGGRDGQRGLGQAHDSDVKVRLNPVYPRLPVRRGPRGRAARGSQPSGPAISLSWVTSSDGAVSIQVWPGNGSLASTKT